ncbi:MAG: ABC transporter substrate-binding protein [Acidiferrobacterales bacterium]|nr:ABC transporter substrate-binding protein [Acidiferrobacterales bacterium]
MFKLGVIVPQSNFLPYISRDLPKACEMGLQGEANIQFFFEAGGYNEDADVLKDKIQNLIVRERIDAVMCPLNPGLIEQVMELCKAEQTALIINTMGEDVLFESVVNGPLFVNSYQLWQTAWLTGYYAAQQGYNNLAAVYARHDGGYGVPLAVAVGAEAGGANVKLCQITHIDSSEEDCTELISNLDKMEPDAIIAHHCSKEALNFQRDAELAKLESPLITLPPYVEELNLSLHGKSAEGISTISPFKSDSDAYREFSDSFKAETGRLPHPHLVLAYESVALINQALTTLPSNRPFDQLVEALSEVSTTGPRGQIGFNPDNKHTLSTCYVREVSKNESGQLYNKTVDEMNVPDLCHEQYSLAQKNTQKQGWVNPYLIA